MNFKFSVLFYLLLLIGKSTYAQLNWRNVDSLYQPLPSSVHVFRSIDSLDGQPNIAFYIFAPLKDRELIYTTDTTLKRRLTPTQFFKKNKNTIVVVNTTFFSFQTNQNLNLVINDGNLLSYNIHSIPGRNKDTLTYRHPFASAFGINKKRKADIAWTLTDSAKKQPYAIQLPLNAIKDSVLHHPVKFYEKNTRLVMGHNSGTKRMLKKWKMQTAVGGGPVLIQNGLVNITNNEELKFAGKAIHDKHPRTAMGYTADGKLIILAVQGRTPGVADGASLPQIAQILKDLGCIEAINLDGGGSSCLLINGKETITPSDKEGQRAVPAVFMIQKRN
jgi:exopolysaccharide biosynthesis protein